MLQKGLPTPFSLAWNRIHMGPHLKEELTNLFSKLPGHSPLPYRQSRQECEHFGNG